METDMLSGNVGKESPLLAKNLRRKQFSMLNCFFFCCVTRHVSHN